MQSQSITEYEKNTRQHFIQTDNYQSLKKKDIWQLLGDLLSCPAAPPPFGPTEVIFTTKGLKAQISSKNKRQNSQYQCCESQSRSTRFINKQKKMLIFIVFS